MFRNATSVELTHLSLSHIRAFVIEQYADVLMTNERMSQPIKNILTQLFQILAISWMMKFSGDFMRHSQLKV